MGFFDEIETSKTAEIGGFQALVPAGEQVNCAIAGVTVEPADDYNNEHVKVQLIVTEKGAYHGFIFYHKLKVNDDNEGKQKTGWTFLLAYDTNCKGKLKEIDLKNQLNVSDAGQLSLALNGGSVRVELDQWVMPGSDGTSRKGNNVSKVMPFHQAGETAHIEKMAESQPAAQTALIDFKDEVPF